TAEISRLFRDGPMPPEHLAVRYFVAGDESADAPVGARDTGDDGIFHNQRRYSGTVMLRLLRHGHFPNHAAGGSIESNQVRVVADHENLVAVQRYTAIGAERCIADKTWRARARVVPDFPARRRIDCKRFIGAGHIHDAVYNERSCFKAEMRS